MTKQQLILDCFSAAGLAVGGSPIPDPANESRYFVFVVTSLDAAGRLQPKRSALKEVAALLAQHGLIIEFLLTDNQSKDILGVLQSDHGATKGIVTTTSNFAPRIINDPFIAPFIPYRLELVNGDDLRKRILSSSK